MRLPGIDTGPVDAARRMLVYFDPNCPVCAQQWQVLRPHLDAVRIHWIPIAYMSASSKRRAAAILAATDPAAALAENENGYDPGRREGGLPLPASVPEWASRAVEENTRKAVRSENVMGTPTLAFELDRGKCYSRRIGLVDAPSLASAFGTTAPRVKAGSLPCVQDRVYAYGKDESGSMAADTGIAARNDMTGIEGTVSGKPSHFDGRTPAGVKKLVDGEEP